MALKDWQFRCAPDESWEPVEDMGVERISERSGCLLMGYYSAGFRWRTAVPLAEGRHKEIFVGGIFYPGGRKVDPEVPHGHTELRWIGEGTPPPAGDPEDLAREEFGSFIATTKEILFDNYISMGKEFPQPTTEESGGSSYDRFRFHRTLNKGD